MQCVRSTAQRNYTNIQSFSRFVSVHTHTSRGYSTCSNTLIYFPSNTNWHSTINNIVTVAAAAAAATLLLCIFVCMSLFTLFTFVLLYFHFGSFLSRLFVHFIGSINRNSRFFCVKKATTKQQICTI